MIEEVLAQIGEAERKAAAAVDAANETAREISLALAAECEAIRAEYDKETKRMVKEILAEAEKTAEKEAAEKMREAEAAAAALERSAEKNIRAAAEWIADVIIKGN